MTVGLQLVFSPRGFGQAGAPDLVAVKAAAEAGDPKAEYEYGKAIPFGRKAEEIEWFLRSARAGYAPAQDALGDYFASYVSDKQRYAANLRESVRWSSRAAYQGVTASQGRIARFYRDGGVLPKDRTAAYIWFRIANGTSFMHTGYTGELNRLITEMSSAEIAAAEDGLKTFRLAPYSGMNPVEADMLFAQLKIGAVYVVNSIHQIVLDNVRFNQGETKDLNLAGEPVRITCLSIEGTNALVAIAGTPYTRWLKR